MRFLAAVFATVTLCLPAPSLSQTADPVADLLLRVEQALTTGDRDAIQALFSADADPSHIDALAAESATGRAVRAVLRERDRPVPPPDASLRLVVDAIVETATHARVSTWRLDLIAKGDGAAGATTLQIGSVGRLSLVDGLFRLSLAPKALAVRNLEVRGEDLRITVPSGVAYAAEVNGLMTALVVIGEGEVSFTPGPVSEKGQLRLFAGEETLRSRVTQLFLRVNPSDTAQRLALDALQPMPGGERPMFERAREMFDEYVARSYSLDLSDLSRDTWSLVPPVGDLLVEMDMPRHGVLTYARSGSDSEDISLFDRRRRKNISVYSSSRKLAMRGSRHYDEQRQLDFAVEHYTVDISYDPARVWMEGRADLDIVIRSAVAQTLTLRLAEALTLRAVTSDQFGRLLALRVRGQNHIVVNLPDALRQGDRLRLRVLYGGRLEPVVPDREALGLGQQIGSDFLMEAEPRFVYSNRSHWYPQTTVSTYATAMLRVTVPEGWTCIGSGIPDPMDALIGVDGKPRSVFVFRATQPLRYLSFLVSRLDRVLSAEVSRPPLATDGDAERAARRQEGVYYDTTSVELWSQRRQSGRARGLLDTTVDVLRFYTGLVDDVPYPAFRLAVVEDTLPGGHSPAYFAILHQPLPGTPFSWSRDPVAFDDFPQFFLAHELGHQFWGQAVAGESYHEQWISEGFAQYFAVLYAERARPKDTFTGILRQMHRSAMDASDQGPIWLGYRLGHLKSDGRIFRAIVYNKGALVLHMLRRLVGEDVFTRGLRRFYGLSRFRRVGTDDLQQAFEAEGGQPLERFFVRWVYEANTPTIRASWEPTEPATAGADGQAPARSGVRLRLEQGEQVYDVPLTVTIQYVDGRTEQILAVARDQVTEIDLPVTGAVRDLRFNEDFGALARVERVRR